MRFIAKGGADHDAATGPELCRGLDDSNARAVGQAQVYQEHVSRRALQQSQALGLGRGPACQVHIRRSLQHPPQRIAEARVVLNDGNVDGVRVRGGRLRVHRTNIVQ